MASGERRKATAREVAALGPGKHGLGDGLYLVKSPSGAARWLFFYKRSNKRREMGLGSYPTVSLADARRKAAEARAVLARGEDPLAEKRKAEAPPTFAKAAEKYIAAKEAEWRNAKHRQQWRNTLAAYAAPIGDKPVADIDTNDVLGCLQSIWTTKAETASRVRQRIEAVLDFAKARGWREGENPARWRGHLALMLAKPEKLGRGHQGAMPYRDVPTFMARLSQANGIAARALAFTILTAARTGEVTGATWGEIDMDAAVWVIPARRMKAGREHKVPLAAPALEILGEMRALAGGNPAPEAPVFPGQKSGRGLSNMAMEGLLRRMGLKEAAVTVHGMRSAFRDWAAEETAFENHVVEMALAHTIGSAVERAYRRGELFEKRRHLMAAWAAYVAGEAADNVIVLRA